MALVPVERDAFRGARRKGITLLCLLVGSAIFSGMFIYIDSYSVHRWNDFVSDTAPAMIITGPHSSQSTSRLDNIDAVTQVTVFWCGQAKYRQTSAEQPWLNYVTTLAYDKASFSQHPDFVTLVLGRFPGSVTEVAINVMESQYENVRINDFLNLTLTYQGIETSNFTVRVVGLYSTNLVSASNYYSYDYYLGGMIVDKSLFTGHYCSIESDTILVDIDRSSLSPLDRGASYSYVKDKETEIMTALDPLYDPKEPWRSEYHLSSILSTSISSYSAWIMLTRISELVRNTGVILLFILTIMIAVRYNVHDRRYESEMLIARGASLSSTQMMTYKEIMGLSVIAGVGGLGIGVILSRFGLISQGFLTYDPSLLASTPLLISIDSLILSLFLTMLLSFLGITGYLVVLAPKPRKEERTGKIAKLGRLLTLIRWDILTIILTSLFMFSLYQSGNTIRSYGFFSLFIYLGIGISPLILFLAVANLYMKWIRGVSYRLSLMLRRVFGKIPSMIGVRRVGRRSSSAVSVTMIIVLAISVAWTNAVVNASLPATKMSQAHYAFGADLSFQLDPISKSNWTNFMGNLSNYEGVEAFTQVSCFTVALDSNHEHSASVVGLKPSEFIEVGYDTDGQPLESSPLKPVMEQLAKTPQGAIITDNLASTLSLSEGNTIRGFTSSSGNVTVTSWSVIGIADALSPLTLTETGTESQGWSSYMYQVVGLNTIWTNWDYIQALVNNSWDVSYKVLVKPSSGVNSTELAERIVSDWQSVLEWLTPYASDAKELQTYLSHSTYMFDGAIDTISVVGSLVVLLVVFLLYGTEDIHSRRREIALLRAMGAGQKGVRRVQVAEMITILLTSSLLLLLFAPIFISSAMMNTSPSNYQWPFLSTIVVPVTLLLGIFFVFVVSVVFFVMLVARYGVKINLAESLNTTWTGVTPLGGEL
ncbi:MAG: FtsX-like permease family protein [Candidatus Thorarchaeota archaeon]